MYGAKGQMKNQISFISLSKAVELHIARAYICVYIASVFDIDFEFCSFQDMPLMRD